MAKQLGAQASELLEVIEAVWGERRAGEIRREADVLSDEAADPKSMTRNYHVYVAAGLPMPAYVRKELAYFLMTGTELAAGRKMTPEISAWLSDALRRLDDFPPPPG